MTKLFELTIRDLEASSKNFSISTTHKMTKRIKNKTIKENKNNKTPKKIAVNPSSRPREKSTRFAC